MYRTKKDVDKHVADINNKIKSAKERNLKGYFIAKLYYQVGDYESARKYLTGYLAEKDSHVIAHKLLGQILEALKQTEKAVAAYKTCFQLDTSQRDVLSSLCRLLLELPVEPGRTKYWIEQAEKQLPHSDILFRLREALVSSTEGESSAEFEAMIKQELSSKPLDANIRIRLIRYYQRSGRIKEAYEEAMRTEEKRIWPTNLSWYKTLLELLENYQVMYKGNLGRNFYGYYLSILDTTLTLEMVDASQYSSISELVSKMDRLLLEAAQSQVPPENNVFEHFQSQFYLHSARLIYRKLTKDIHPGSIKENHRTLGAALLAAYSSQTTRDISGDQWSHLRGCEHIRRSIAGHCLLSLAERFGGLDNYRERLASNSGINAKISGLIFVSVERRNTTEASFLTSNQFPVDILTAEFPSAAALVDIDREAARNSLTDLNTLIWILVRNSSTESVLTLPIPNVNGLPEVPPAPYLSVSQMDAHSFLYAATYTAGYLEDKDPEFLLPPYLGTRLSTSDQDTWWKLVQSSGEGTLAPVEKRTLQYGLDAIRCKGLHGLDAQLTLRLGKTYEYHAIEAAATAESDQHANDMVTVLEERAATYYKAALASIEKLEAGLGLREPILRLFPAPPQTPSKADIANMRQSAIFYLAVNNMHQGYIDEALKQLKQVKTPFASFHSAEIYKKLAQEEKINQGTELGLSPAYTNYLTDARESLYLTLDRLKNEPPTHPLNATLGDVLEEVENLLHGAEGGADLTNGNHEPPEINRLVSGRHMSSTPRSSRTLQQQFQEQLSSSVGLRTNPSTPNRSLFREEAKPSPERLDAQIRQISHHQDGLVRQLSARDQELLDSSKEAVSVNKDLLSVNKEVLVTNQQMMAVLKEVKIDVQEVRTIRAELVNLRDDIKVRMDRALDLLQKIADKPTQAPSTTAPSPPSETAYSLSEEEKLLLESFGLGTSSASAAAAYQINLQQQQLMLAMAAAQQQQQLAARPAAVRPLMPGMSPYGGQAVMGGGMYPGHMYGVPQLPTMPAVATVAEIQTQPQLTPQPAIHASVIQTTPTLVPKVKETGPPTNVVISKSDKIPTVAPPIVSMSVTVPAQHRFGVSTPQTPKTPQQSAGLGTPQSAYRTPLGPGLGTPHGFQINMPSGTPPSVSSSPFGESDTPAVVITTQSLLSTISTPVYSAVTPSPTKGVNTSGGKTRSSSGGTPRARQPSTGGEEVEEYEPDVDFKPVIPLPEEVEVVTGEEDEEILFEDRAKLFRFADDTKEWKERGLGQAKILRNNESGMVRFLMRREQTFKVCANHNLHPDIKLDAMKGNTKARIWGAQDFADGESRTEKFCIKLKTEEQVEKFASVFASAAKSANTSPKKSVKPTAAKDGGKGVSLADFAKSQKASSWECQGCLTRNDNAKIQCLACESAKPGCEEEVKKLKDAAKPAAAGVSFGSGGGMKFNFGTPTATTTTAATAAPLTGGFSFGTPKASTTTSTLSFGSSVSSVAAPSFGASSSATSVAAPTFGAGGFTFSSTPTINKTEEKKEDKPKPAEEVAKPSPFSSFSFGAKVEAVKEAPPVLGAGTTASFGSLNQSTPTDAFKTDPTFKGFSTAGSQLFGSQKQTDEGDGDATEEYEPDVEFAPVVPLPALVEVKTGEEDEDVLFSERSKLYRFVSESKEWKERGIGDFKILKNRDTKRVRFLMRREQVHKICCNHALTSDIEVKPMSTSDKAWTWTAPDFSEGEIKNEVFGLKFKTPDLAASFKNIVDECQKELKNAPATKPVKKEEPKAAANSGSSLADFAKSQKASSWECQGCLTRNDNAKIQCLACESAKPGCEEEVAKLKDAAKPAAAGVSFGSGGGMKFSFGAPAAASPAAGSGFSFGTPTAAAPPASGGFSFGTPKGAEPPAKEESPKPPFGTKDKHDFSFGGVRTSPRKHNESATSENEYYQEEDEGDNIYFEPIIPLPEKVEVKTGEEEEEVVYSHKAKVFRFTDGEWKERGVGDIKVLKHQTSGKVRLLMRREQVLKICLNHYVTPQLVSGFKEKDTKSWTWGAQDFSDGELTSMTFALRFKTPDISADFKSALDAAVATMGTAAVTATTETKLSATTARPTKAESKAASPAASGDENLFQDKDFRPLSPLERENELSFEGLGLKLNTEQDAKDVADKIRAEKNMHILTFSANTIGIDAAKAIGEALAERPEFRRAHWKDMFTGRMKTEIPPALINLTRGVMTAQARLVELDLSDNAFGPIGMEGLTTFMRSPSCYTLQELRLNNTGCGVTGGKLLAKTLNECYERSCKANHPLALKVFVLGRSRQENEGGKALAEVFKKMGSLEELVMPQNGIYHEGLTVLADALANNPNLRILNLNDNTFTEKGARAMAAALKKLNNLEVLNLGDCLLKSAGAQHIARALKGRHPNLRELVLDSNEIRMAGGLEVVTAVADKDNLELLSLDGNWFGEAGEKSLQKRLKEVNRLEVLGSMEDNEEADEDEDDPVLEDDEEDDTQEDATSSPAVKTPGSIFSGSSASSTTAPAKNLFGGGGSTVFGGTASPAAVAAPPTGLFGTPSNTTKSSSIFGGTPSGTTSIFGGSAGGGNLFGGGASSGGGLFGSAAAADSSTPLFGKPAAAVGSSFAFGTPTSEAVAVVDSTTKEASNSLFTSNVSAFSFSSLAEDGEKKGFGFGSKTEDFKFQGAGSTLFGKTTDTSKNEGGEEDEDEEDDGHDPHFEPIVPLPELVETKTGEEEEEVLFKHRAKVYRFDGDNKEWKERGVGDIKILHHATRGSYRVLLRRDQVYKIACNHLISRDMSLKPLSSSETAWCWFAVDHSEGCPPEGSHDQLAVRFKTKDTAEDFKATFEACQAKVGDKSISEGSQSTAGGSLSTARGSQSTEVKEGVSQESTGSTWKDTNVSQQDDEEEYYDDDDETAPMFDAECKMWVKGQSGAWDQPTNVMLRIVYDDDVYGARIMARAVEAHDEQPDLADHIIAIQTQLGDDLSWSALDYSGEEAVKKTFKVQFQTDDVTNDFRDIFAQGKEFAEQCEISENGGGEMDDPAQFYYGVGGDE